MDSKSQRNGVQNELRRLREAQLASNQREKMKDVSSTPLTTPEEAQRFLLSMREKQHERDNNRPPAHLKATADGMNAWYLQQRHKEQELRDRKREAEAILRNYRGTAHLANTNTGSQSRDPSPKEGFDPHPHDGSDAGMSPSSAYYYQPGSFAGIPNTASASPSIGTASHGFFDASHRKLQEQGQYQWNEEKKESHEPRESISPRFASSPSKARNFMSPPLPEGLANNKTPNMEGSSTSGASYHSQRQSSFRGRNNTALQVDTTAPESTNRSLPSQPETIWRDFVSNKPGSKFTAEPGRYHLYGSYACPGTHRALIVRALKGLQTVISVTYLHPVWRLTNPHNPADKHRGWVFGDEEHGEPFTNTIGKGGPFPPAFDDNEPDPSNVKASSVREIYEYANDTSGKYTIPLLWDTKLKTIVNNESSDIAYMFNSCFNDFAENPDLDLYTEDDVQEKTKLYQVSEWLSPLMIHGVYRCGFAKTQWAYDRAINDLCAAFDRADDTLEQQRYLTGDTLTDVDIRLFVTLLRFDEVYTVYFKANARLVMLTPSLLNFCRDIFQMPGVAETCNMEQIKAHFFASHAEWNKYSVIPRGLGFMELLDMPHDRDYGFGGSSGDNGDEGIVMIPPPSQEDGTEFAQGFGPTDEDEIHDDLAH